MFKRHGVGQGGKDKELRQRGMICAVDLRKDPGVRKNKDELKHFSRITAVVFEPTTVLPSSLSLISTHKANNIISILPMRKQRLR